jgi:hypothetical protein
MIGVVGFFLAGKKIWWAWYINIANQVLWTAYSLLSEQYGFLVVSFVYFVVFSKNAYEWTYDHLGGFHWRDTLWLRVHGWRARHGGTTSYVFQPRNGERGKWECERGHVWYPKPNFETLVYAQDTRCVHWKDHGKDRKLIPCPPQCLQQSWPESIFKWTWRGWKLRERLTLPEVSERFDIVFNRVAMPLMDPERPADTTPRLSGFVDKP